MEVENDIQDIKLELNNVEKSISEELNKHIIGIDIVHKKFGKGKVIKQNEDKIDVKFESSKEITLKIPFVFINNMVSCEDSIINNKMLKIDKLMREKIDLEKEIAEKENKLKEITAKNERKAQTNIENTNFLAVTTGSSYQDDIEMNIHYCKAERVQRKCEYLGLYKDKSIIKIGKIKKVVTANKINGQLNIISVEGEDITDNDKKNIEECIRRAVKLFNVNIGDIEHKYFIVDKFYDTDFKKISPNGLMEKRYFDLYKELNATELPTIEKIAEELSYKTWK